MLPVVASHPAPAAPADARVLVGGLDAVVLAGGRSSRLGGAPKTTLERGGRTLVELALAAAAAAGAGRIVLVGPTESLPPRHRLDTAAAPATLQLTREDPPYSGPAAALGAALEVLVDPADAAAGRTPGGAAFTLVLACDQPRAQLALPSLLDAAAGGSGEVGDSEKGRSARASGLISPESHADLPLLEAPPADAPPVGADRPDRAAQAQPVGAWVAVDEGQAQPLLGVFRRGALVEAIRACAVERPGGTVEGASMRQVLAHLVLEEVPVPAGSAADVDTWDAAARLGVTRPSSEHGGWGSSREVSAPGGGGSRGDGREEDA